MKQEYKTNGGAAWAGIRDLRRREEPDFDSLLTEDRLDGKTVLVTGASSGLGLSVSREAAHRGARVLMVCRRDAAKELASVQHAGDGSAEVVRADFADFSSIRALVADLARRGETVHRVISNAALVPASARKTVDGFEEMVQVNFLAPTLLIRGLLEAGVIPNKTLALKSEKASTQGKEIPRIVVVASEAHRSPDRLDLENLEKVEPYGMAQSTARYGWTKLLLLTWTLELARRLAPEGVVDVSVHALCPGPVASNIAREAPAIAQPFAKLFFALFFQSPKIAALPVVYLSSSPRIEGQTGIYLFTFRRREPSEIAELPENGRAIWDEAQRLVASRPAA